MVPRGPDDAEVSFAPFSRKGSDSAQWLPLPAVQAASRLVSDPALAASRAVVRPAVLASMSTVMFSRASAGGSLGPAACQVAPV